jgi:hypothetical protein
MSTRLGYVMPSRLRAIAMAILGAGIVVVLLGLMFNPQRTWPNLLLNGFYVISLALSALFFLATQWLTGARWSASLRRIPEALAMALPVLAIPMVLLFFGRQYLFPWSRPGALAHEPAFAGKIQYLQTPWVFTRMAVALATWALFAWWFRRISLRQDREPGLSLVLHKRLTTWAAVFTLAFALTFTLGAFDWLISLDPQWFSTMFAVYIFAGTFVQGIAAVTLSIVLMRERGPLGDVVSNHQVHDLGKMLFAFSTFWAYIWVAQYLLIWYGNIPEEVTHFVKRTNGPWLYLFALNLILNWVIPFAVLLSRPAKCNTKVLKIVCCIVLAGHWLDLYILIMPTMWSTPRFGLVEIGATGAFLSLLFLLFARNLAHAPLVPLNDPILEFERAHQLLGPALQPNISGVEQ